MALLELTETPYFSCTNIVIAVDRHVNPGEQHDLVRFLGWAGFEAVTLDRWMQTQGLAMEKTETSDRWLFLGMEV